jgi:hypothetical protein
MTKGNDIREITDKAGRDYFIGPDRPYYALLAGLESVIGGAWQHGYDHHRTGGSETDPYR